MTNAWSPERRARQRALIARCKPWTRSSGPRTAPGKASSAKNARKHGRRSRGHYSVLRQISNYIRICHLTEKVIRQALRNGGILAIELSVLERLTDESFETLCAGLSGQVIPKGSQKNSRVSTKELLAGQATAKESPEISTASQAEKIFPGGPQKISRFSTNELLANQESAKESLVFSDAGLGQRRPHPSHHRLNPRTRLHRFTNPSYSGRTFPRAPPAARTIPVRGRIA